MKHDARSLPLVCAALLCVGFAAAQGQSANEWKAALSALQDRVAFRSAASPAELARWRAEAEDIRGDIAAFARRHPETRVQIPPALPGGAAREAISKQLPELVAAADAAMRGGAGVPFDLGRITVTASAPGAPAAPVATSAGQSEMESKGLLRVSQALDSLPGVSIQHIATNRNEAGIMVRGFSSRGQTPMYLDGVPIYVPYDGYVDFNRFLTADLAEVQVARGYASPLMGPNALGGAINLVTRQPVKPVEAEMSIGLASGDGLASSGKLGARRKTLFFQGSFDWLQQGYIPLSGAYTPVQYKSLPEIVMTGRLNHSYSRDERVSGRLGWTPRKSDQYVFSYSNQKGNKGVPLYQGANTGAAFRNFWEWPYWNENGYYLHTDTAVGDDSRLKLRAFYNRFRNSINMYSDATYRNMNTKSAEHSMYNEHTEGFSGEFDNRTFSLHQLGASFFLKNDVHTESGIYPGMSPYPLTTPVLADKDRQESIGLEDVIRAARRLRVTLGFSADHLEGIQAQSYNSALTALVPFTCRATPQNTSFSGCTAHVWNVNPQAAVSYAVGDSSHFFVTFADRGRFPMLKDIYSASMGAGLPNPDLRPERSRNWNAGYSAALPAHTVATVTLFRSDLRNAIESVYVTDPGGSATATANCPSSKIAGFCSQMVNIGREVHEGVELEVRSSPLPRLTAEASYSYLNRNITYDFATVPSISPINTSVVTLPAMPKNKLAATATVRLPRGISALAIARYEGGITVQDTTYAATSPLYLPRGECYAAFGLGLIAPVYRGVELRAGANNLFDRNYFYVAGYPEIGRNWAVDLRYRF